MIETVTNSGLKYDEKEVKVDVCQAIQEIRLEPEQIGKERGEKQGILKKPRRLLIEI